MYMLGIFWLFFVFNKLYWRNKMDVMEYIDKKLSVIKEDELFVFLCNAIESTFKGTHIEAIYYNKSFYFRNKFDTNLMEIGFRNAEERGKGLFVHIFNKDIISNIIEEEVKRFMEISGEVCFSEIGDIQFSTRKKKIGVILEGYPEYQWPFDCYSEVVTRGKEKGLRYATRYQDRGLRNETWLIPSKCRLWGLVVEGFDNEDVRKAADKLCCMVVPFSGVNNYEEEEEVD